MSRSNQLMPWVVEALTALGGSGTVIEVSRAVWEKHEEDLRASGDLFYSWQYDLRWAAQKLRDSGTLERMDGGRSAAWSLVRKTTSFEKGREGWSDQEIAVTVDSYFRMLEAELAGDPYRKVDENSKVVEATGRSRGAVEFKYANISAVLDELGLTYVAGYKPRSNYQVELRTAVAAAVAARTSNEARLAGSETSGNRSEVSNDRSGA
ncbi:hypothetical protein [Aeromicrobium sp. S22]|uniref:hypothetical protein n=1 Tax=Aeromicrobium sp. S22 TaxID=2662029 RepID=UPI00189290BA|nr:hypothetical protein [Aeromicrobium sp. S22]